MEILKEKSLNGKRQEQDLPKSIEQSLTELELRDIEKDRTITELELAVLELQSN